MPDQRSRWSASHRAVPMKLRHVDVVAAGVHHADLAPGLVARLDLAGVGQPGLLDDRQRVHVGADQHDRPVAVLEDARRPRACRRSS